MMRRMRPLLSILVTLALTATLLGWLAGLTERKDSRYEYAPFLQEEAGFDVLFFGTSHMIYGVYPMELWQDYGIASYNLAGHGIHIPTVYWVMKNALLQHRPRLVVVDCYLLEKQTKMFNNFSQVHQSLDVFPLTLTKIRAAFDLLNDSGFDAEFPGRSDRTRTKMGLLWSFSQYHDRWTELGQDDFSPKYTTEKGAESFNIDVAVPRTSQPTDAVLEETTGMEYLRRIVEDCQREGIDVLLVYLPFPPGETERKEANTARMIAQEYGVDYIDYLDSDVVDLDTDCLDYWSHLNPSGARKVTDHLGQYIRERYGIPDRRQDPAWAGWYADYQAYTDYKLELLAKQTELKNYLVLLQDKHLNGCVYLAESGLWAGAYQALLENAGVDAGQLPAQGPALAVLDREAGAVYLLRPGDAALASFGQVRFEPADGAYAVRVDGEAVLTAGPEAVSGAVILREGGQAAAAALFASGPEGEKKLDG